MGSLCNISNLLNKKYTQINLIAGDSGMPFAQHKGEDRASESSAKGGLP
jgi:hypothetical protein